MAPEEFYGQFLPRVVSVLAAIGGAVWTLNPEGQLVLQNQINIQETILRESSPAELSLYTVPSPKLEVPSPLSANVVP